MARAHSLYVVQNQHGIVRGFTVKHELVGWLEQQEEAGRTIQMWSVVRIPDGRDGEIVYRNAALYVRKDAD